MRFALALAIGSTMACGAKSTQVVGTDGDSDSDCPSSVPAGPIAMARGCANTIESVADHPLGVDDVEPCSRDADCALLSLDACCGFDIVAVLALRRESALACVAPCVNNPGCTECAGPDVIPACLNGRCSLLQMGF